MGSFIPVDHRNFTPVAISEIFCTIKSTTQWINCYGIISPADRIQKSLLTQLFHKKNMSQVTSNCYEEAAAIDLITIMILFKLT